MNTDWYNTKATLPADLRQRMGFAGMLPRIRNFILPTMRTLTDRFISHLDDFGWIDMKFNPVDGAERDSSIEHYRKDRIYGWIQGRGLESLTAHVRWTEDLPGYDLLDTKGMIHCAEVLYGNLLASCFSEPGPRVSFIMDPTGNPASPVLPAGTTTLTQLFVLRGLMSFASYRNYSDDLERIIPALRKAVDASMKGLCVNDQISFGADTGANPTPNRTGYEGQMIAIGACELLFTHTEDDEDFARGIGTIDSVLSRHCRSDGNHGMMLADGLSPDGRPFRDGGRLVTDPGHALEFVGLALQFIRRSAPFAADRLYQSSQSPRIETLRSLAFVYNRLGRAPHGGVMKSIDAESAEPINGDCPWWSSFEAIRTWAEILEIARDEAERFYCVEQLDSYINCIEKLYMMPSSIAVPIQTVDYKGQAIPVIPATPDIDPGYHTGIPLIDAYELLGTRSTMRCGLGECRIPPLLGKRLQGHVARSKGAEHEMDPLYARCCWIATAREQFLLVSADVLEFSPQWSENFSTAVSLAWGIPPERIILLATHTHTAPCAIKLGLLEADTEFLVLLEKAMENAIRDASGELRPMVGTIGSVDLPGIGINRRKPDPVTGQVSMKPNPLGDRDDEVTSFFLFDVQGRLRGMLSNLAVHPTTLGVSVHQISADYPGRMVRELKKRLGPSMIAIPLQGACGDVRPMVVDEKLSQFREGTEQDLDRIGLELAVGILGTLDSALQRGVWIEGGTLSFYTRELELPFHTLPVFEEVQQFALRTRAELEESTHEPGAVEGFMATHENPLLSARTYLAWAERLLEGSFDAAGAYIGKRSVSAAFSCWFLGSAIGFFTLPGEAFCRIGLALKKAVSPSAAMICGYCGGSVGYIPTSDAFIEGGYEIESAFRFYGYPAPLAADTEMKIIGLFKSMIE